MPEAPGGDGVALIRPGIAYYSTSTTKSHAECAAGVAGISAQLLEDYCPAYSRLPLEATFFENPKDIPDGMPAIQLADRCKLAGALAFHTESAGGRITGVVGMLDAEEDGEPWTVGASHEGLEAARNPFVNGWTTARGFGGRRKVANEDADPVQDGSYKKNGVDVSNFVYPAWFDGLAPEGSKFDHLGQLSAPFTKTEGGYIEIDTNGVVTQLGEKKTHRTRVKNDEASDGGCDLDTRTLDALLEQAPHKSAARLHLEAIIARAVGASMRATS